MTTQTTQTQITTALATVREQTGRVFRRSRTDRMLSGVCGAIGEKLGIDANIVRLGVVLLTVLGFGTVAVVYVAAWIVAPDAEVAPTTPVDLYSPVDAYPPADSMYVPPMTDPTVR